MSFLSQPGFVGFKTQSVAGTYKDPGAVDPDQGIYVKNRSGSIGTNRDLMIPDPEIGGTRDISDVQLGPASFGGEYSFYLRMESAAFFLANVLGASSTAGPTAVTAYTHTIGTANTIPWVSIEEQIGDGMLNLQYKDFKINTFHMEADANGYLMGTAGLIGKTQSVDSVPTLTAAQRWDTSPLLVGPEIVLTYNGAALPAKSFSLDINNNIESDDFRLGSLFLGDVTPKRRELTMGVTIRPSDAALWKQGTWGTSSATVLGGTKTAQQGIITITSYEDIPGSTAGTKYVMTVTIPKLVIKPYNLAPSGDDVIQTDLELQAIRPVAATDLITVTVKNSLVTVP